MPCSQCTREFSFFHREVACPNCGFSYCSGCLKHKVILPKTGKENKVCTKCHELLSSQRPAPLPSPPKALQKRMENLVPSGPPKGLGGEDKRIAERLEKLHQERRGESRLPPSEDEVRQRLNKLKGTSGSGAQGTSSYYQPLDQRTATEQTMDLMSGAKAEVEIDKMILSPEDDIAARLSRLKGTPIEKSKSSSSVPDPINYLGNCAVTTDDDLDEVAKLMASMQKDAEKDAQSGLLELKKDKAIQEQLDRLKVKSSSTKRNAINNEDEDEDEGAEEEVIKQLLEEQRLEERMGEIESVPSTKSTSEPEELPWCVICNEDAIVRCQGCDGDLYCNSCYREFHVDEDLQEHRTTKYKKKS